MSWQIINEKYIHWIIMVQEFDLKFATRMSKRGLDLGELIFEFPTDAPDPLINDGLWDEHLFTITLDDPEYDDIITYLRT